MSAFSTRLKDLLDEGGFEQQYLGAIVGVSPQAVSNWILDHTRPSKTNMNLIADFFQVSLDYLEGRTNDRTTNQTSASTSPTAGEPAVQAYSKPDVESSNMVVYWKKRYSEATTQLKHCQEQATLLKQLLTEKDMRITLLEARV